VNKRQIAITPANKTPATGHTIQVVSHAFVKKLQARYIAVADSQYAVAIVSLM